MKYVYAAIVLVVCIVGYFVFTQTDQAKVVDTVPEGYEQLSDGSLIQTVGEEGGTTTLQAIKEVTPDNRASITLDPNARIFKVTGINYDFDTKEIRVKKGETVTIDFESTDGFHDLVIDEFNARTKKVQPGVHTSVTFVADKAGTFEYYCSVGANRAKGMVGNLVVEE